METISNELDRFIIARWMYSIGEPIMEDAEYTMLLRSIEARFPDYEYVHRSWSSDPCPIELLKQYGMSQYIYNIVLTDKTESIPSLNSWSEIQHEYETMNSKHTLSFKHDGWNLQASYYNGVLVQFQTRGRHTDAMSVEYLENRIPHTIPEMGKVTVCMEGTISFSNFNKLKVELNLKSQRGAVSSCLARLEYVNYIDLHAFSIIGETQELDPFPKLKDWGFNVPEYRYVSTYQELMKCIEELSYIAGAYDSPTDGLVLRGEKTRALRVAYWEEPIYKSYVTGYEESYGAHRIGVKCAIRPIKLANSTQRLVSCTNYQRIIDNNLRIGFPVVFRLTSMAIADLDEESTRLLQEEWQGREEVYRAEIDANEAIKECNYM